MFRLYVLAYVLVLLLVNSASVQAGAIVPRESVEIVRILRQLTTNIKELQIPFETEEDEWDSIDLWPITI